MRIELVDLNYLKVAEELEKILPSIRKKELQDKIKMIAESMKEYVKEQRIRKVSTAANLSHKKKDLFDLYESRSDYEKNVAIIKKILASGHDSISEHDQFTFFITGVTPVIEQILISHRLLSFTVQSRRYVDFRDSGFHTPDLSYLKNGNEAEKIYKDHMTYLFDVYSKMVEQEVPKEDARFILPYCFHSQIVMTLNARSLIKLIKYCCTSNMSQIREVKEFGERMLEIAKEKIPYYDYDKLEKYIKENQRHEDKLAFLDTYHDGKYTIVPSPKLIKAQTDYIIPRIDRTIIVSYIMNKYQKNFKEANRFYTKLSGEEKRQIMSVICMSKENEENRELEQVSFKFELPISLAGLTHLTRQRMQSLLIPDFLPMYDLKNQIIPQTIKDSCLELYLDAVEKNRKVYEQLKQMGVDEKDLVYFNLSGTMINVSSNINGRELLWISRLRCCKRAQWEIREITFKMIDEIKKKNKKLIITRNQQYIDYLGAPCAITGKCPEGSHSCGNPYTYKRRSI